MENTSATTLTETSLLDARALLDGDSDGLISHELGHQWWGDLVTCKDWAHIWLNEGFASYCEVLWDEHRHGADEAAYNLWQKRHGAVAGGKSRPIVDRRYSNPDSMFDARAYPKGAWVLHMLRKQLGDNVFFKGLRLYGTENGHKSVETSDFRKVMERVSGRDLERFFYDWTERPGHPVLNVTSTYLPESKQVKVVVKQTQPGEAFTFFLNSPERPKQILIDPDLTLLCELTEEKGRDLWLNQLRDGPTAAARVMAVEHFAKSKRPSDEDALVAALKNETFWGVKVRIAEALGDIGRPASRTALIAGLDQPDARVRRACARALGGFRKDAGVTAAVKTKLNGSDPSAEVEAALLGAYAKLQPDDIVTVATPYLAKPSRRETIRAAAIGALAASQDISTLDTLIAWTKRGKPLPVRTAALGGLAELAKHGNPSEADRKRIVEAVAAGLENEGPRVRSAAVRSLRDLGQSAAVSLPALEAIASHDPDGRVQEAAAKAVEAIRSNSPAPVELGRLREELDRLKSANAALQERLDRFERKSKKD
jgi:aminopeptidase N